MIFNRKKEIAEGDYVTFKSLGRDLSGRVLQRKQSDEGEDSLVVVVMRNHDGKQKDYMAEVRYKDAAKITDKATLDTISQRIVIR